jgi:hypothetical protein
MRQRLTVASPRLEARLAGLLYLFIIILGSFAEIGVDKGWLQRAIRRPPHGQSWRTRACSARVSPLR